jgi:hypothetical protein
VDDIEPRARKILRALVEVVATTAEMYVRDVEELHDSLAEKRAPDEPKNGARARFFRETIIAEVRG